MFEAKLMKKRLQLGLPLIQAPNLGRFRLMFKTSISNFWSSPRKRLVSCSWRTETSPRRGRIFAPRVTSSALPRPIERVEPGENVEAIIEIAFMQGVHPAKGLES